MKNDPQLGRTIFKAVDEEENWLRPIIALENDDLDNTRMLSWSGYHSSRQQKPQNERVITGLLPLFQEEVTSPAMIIHAFDVVKQAIEFLNPGQNPVITGDQPVYSVMKSIQWLFSERHGESEIVVMMKGLHTEMAALRSVGDILVDSGWGGVLPASGLTTPGVAESFLRASHLKRMMYAHDVTLATLATLLHDAFTNSDYTVKDKWIKYMLQKSPTFYFWHLVMKYEIVVFIFVRAHRKRNFQLYIAALEELVPLFFAMDHTNYSRWLPIHVSDLKHLPAAVEEQILAWNWVIAKTQQQENECVKDSGGAVGLCESPTAFRQ